MVSLKGKKVYLDASTVIYAIEVQLPNLGLGLMIPLDNQEFDGVTSEITIPETIIGPRKAGNVGNERLFREFLTPTSSFSIMPVTRDVLEKVIDLRSQFNLKTPDAIHIATGMLAGCDLFVTSDLAWGKTGVAVVDPAEIGP